MEYKISSTVTSSENRSWLSLQNYKQFCKHPQTISNFQTNSTISLDLSKKNSKMFVKKFWPCFLYFYISSFEKFLLFKMSLIYSESTYTFSKYLTNKRDFTKECLIYYLLHFSHGKIFLKKNLLWLGYCESFVRFECRLFLNYDTLHLDLLLLSIILITFEYDSFWREII